jgi:hypothetical protein
MMQWSTNRTNPAAAVRQGATRMAPPSQTGRIAAPATTRQSTTAAPIGSRGAQFRAAEMQRSTPALRGATKTADDDPDDEKDEKDDRETLFGRGEDDDDDGLDDGNTSPDDEKDSDPDDDKPDDDKPDDDKQDDEKKKKAKS